MAHLDHVAGAGPPGERLCKAGRQNRPPGARSLAKDASGTVTRVPAFPPCRGSSGRARDGNRHARTHLYHTAGPIFSVPFLKSVRWAVKVASAVKCSTRRHTNLLSVPCSICGSCDEESGWPFSPRLGFQELLPAALHGPPRRGPPTGSPPLTFTGRSCGTVSQGLVHADAFRAPALRTCPGRESTVTRGGTHAGHGGECAERRGALRGSGPGRG